MSRHLFFARDQYSAAADRQFTTAEVSVTLTRHRRGSRAAAHAHNGPYLCLVASGSFDESGPHQTLVASQGVVIAHPGNDLHANWFGSADVQCINFAPRAGGRLEEFFLHSIASPTSWRAPQILQRAVTELRSNDRWTAIGLELLAVEMLKTHARLASVSHRRHDWSADVRDYIEGVTPRVPGLSELCQRFGFHQAHLSRAFRVAFGESPVEFGRQCRAAWARAQIEGGARSLSQVAAAGGYADHAHMSRDLRSRYALSPHQLRRTSYPDTTEGAAGHGTDGSS